MPTTPPKDGSFSGNKVNFMPPLAYLKQPDFQCLTSGPMSQKNMKAIQNHQVKIFFKALSLKDMIVLSAFVGYAIISSRHFFRHGSRSK